MTKSQSFFIAITSKEDKDKIFRELVSKKTELTVKSLDSDAGIFHAEPTVIEDDSTDLTCKVLGKAQLGPEDDEVIVKFSLGETLYMCQASFRYMYGVLYLDTRGKLFRVQRRDSFRVKLPVSFQGKVRLDTLERQPLKKAFGLMDLSGGGCRFLAPAADSGLASGQQWTGALLMPGKPEIPIAGNLIHIVAHPTDKDRACVGTAFAGANQATTNRIEGIVMDLYRALFSRR